MIKANYVYDREKNRALLRLYWVDGEPETIAALTMDDAANLCASLADAMLEAFNDFTATVPKLPPQFVSVEDRHPQNGAEDTR